MPDYEIFSGNTMVAVWENEHLDIKNEKLLPLFLKRVNDADKWLETRAVDSHRANSRLLKKALRLTEKDDVSTVIFANGATITDNYWIRPIGSTMQYSDVTFKYDFFSKRIAKLAIDGDFSAFNYVAKNSRSTTYELTNVGSFEKCWKMINSKWWLFKKATQREQFSEIFISKLGHAIGINTAIYEKYNDCVKSLDFTDGAKVNFEPALSFMGDNEDYDDVIAMLKKLCPKAIPDYIRLIFLDTITANPDRHTGNFGLLRDIDSGEIIGLAPCFDHNMALISRGYPSNPKGSDLLITLFCDVINKNPQYKKYIPDIKEETVRDLIKEIGMKVKTQAVVDLIINRYEMIKNN